MLPQRRKFFDFYQKKKKITIDNFIVRRYMSRVRFALGFYQTCLTAFVYAARLIIAVYIILHDRDLKIKRKSLMYMQNPPGTLYRLLSLY